MLASVAIIGILMMGIGGYQFALYSSYLQSCITNHVPCPYYDGAINDAHSIIYAGLTIFLLGTLASLLTVYRRNPATLKATSTNQHETSRPDPNGHPDMQP